MSNGNGNYHPERESAGGSPAEPHGAGAVPRPGGMESLPRGPEAWRRMFKLIRAITPGGERLTFDQVISLSERNAKLYESFMIDGAPIRAFEVRVDRRKVSDIVLNSPEGLKEAEFESDLRGDVVLHVWCSAVDEVGQVPLLFCAMDEIPAKGLSETVRYSHGRSMTFQVRPKGNGEFNVKVSFAVEEPTGLRQEHSAVAAYGVAQAAGRGGGRFTWKLARFSKRAPAPRTTALGNALNARDIHYPGSPRETVALLLVLVAISLSSLTTMQWIREIVQSRPSTSSEATRQPSPEQPDRVAAVTTSSPAGACAQGGQQADTGSGQHTSPTSRSRAVTEKGPTVTREVTRARQVANRRTMPSYAVAHSKAFNRHKSRGQSSSGSEVKKYSASSESEMSLFKWSEKEAVTPQTYKDLALLYEYDARLRRSQNLKKTPGGKPLRDELPGDEESSSGETESAYVPGRREEMPPLAASGASGRFMKAGWPNGVPGGETYGGNHGRIEYMPKAGQLFYVEKLHAPHHDRYSKEVARLGIINAVESAGGKATVKAEDQHRAAAIVKSQFGEPEREFGQIYIALWMGGRKVWSAPQDCRVPGQTNLQRALCNASLQLGESIGSGRISWVHEDGRWNGLRQQGLTRWEQLTFSPEVPATRRLPKRSAARREPFIFNAAPAQMRVIVKRPR